MYVICIVILIIIIKEETHYITIQQKHASKLYYKYCESNLLKQNIKAKNRKDRDGKKSTLIRAIWEFWATPAVQLFSKLFGDIRIRFRAAKAWFQCATPDSC